MATAPTKADPKRPTPKLIEERAVLEAERRELDRESRNRMRRIDQIDAEVEAYVRFKEPKALAWVYMGYRWAIVRKRKAARWKDELIKAVGVARVNEIELEQGEAERFTVERVKA